LLNERKTLQDLLKDQNPEVVAFARRFLERYEVKFPENGGDRAETKWQTMVDKMIYIYGDDQMVRVQTEAIQALRNVIEGIEKAVAPAPPSSGGVWGAIKRLFGSNS
jgi:hypothetical protein